MQTQRDHVHAHQFQMGRMSSALVLGDPSPAQDPGRRAVVGMALGIGIAVLLIGAFAVYGWIVPGGNSSWQAQGTIIVEKETGTRYVYVDGQLHPTPNLASALLIEGAQAHVRLTSHKSLAGVPHGSAIGLPDAPQVLPAPADVAHGPWLVCAPPRRAVGPIDSVGLNFDPSAPNTPLAADRFALVSSGGDEFLLWHDHRYLITDRTVPAALGITDVEPSAVPDVWLAQIPDGGKLAPPAIPGAGDHGPRVGGRVYPVGQLFQQSVSNGGEQLFVLRKDGLAPVGRTAFVLLQAKQDGDPVRLNVAAVAAAPHADDHSMLTSVPEVAGASEVDLGDQVLCVRQRPAGAQAVTGALVTADKTAAGVRPDGTGRTTMRPGAGMVLYPVPLPPLHSPQLSLVDDTGVAYALPDPDSLSALRLSGAPAVPFPKALLDTLRGGPVLSRKSISGTEEG